MTTKSVTAHRKGEHKEPAEMPLPPYSVRVSRRARRVNLRISVECGLEIAVPRWFDLRQLPAVIDEKRGWIDRAWRQVEERRTYLVRSSRPPKLIHLRSIGETWRVEYVPAPLKSVRLSDEQAGTDGVCSLRLRGAVGDFREVRSALHRWIARRARTSIASMHDEVSRECGLPYEGLTLRNQKSRWGSCSRKKTTSLNMRLLFLPRRLARYLLIHELCHTRAMNHSRDFWRLVAEKEPEGRRLDRELNKAWQYVPGWMSYEVE